MGLKLNASSLIEFRSVCTWWQWCVFFCRRVWTVALVTMQTISGGINIMLTTSKVCVIVARCERTLHSKYSVRDLHWHKSFFLVSFHWVNVAVVAVPSSSSSSRASTSPAAGAQVIVAAVAAAEEQRGPEQRDEGEHRDQYPRSDDPTPASVWNHKRKKINLNRSICYKSAKAMSPNFMGTPKQWISGL